MKRTGKVIATLLGVVILGALLASCSNDYATPTSDTYLCVFASHGSQRLKKQLPPGSDRSKIGRDDTVVVIPTSNRFFMATADDTLRDPLAPTGYDANAQGGVPVTLAGQVRFRFNLPKACEWYSKHGRRNANSNGDLGFNARGDAATTAGWFHFLAENFGLTMDNVAKRVMNQYDWAKMYYDYPVNADTTGAVKGDPGQATDDLLGVALGQEFTNELNANLGGQYFCGIETSAGSANDCPPMTFQVKGVVPTGDSGQKLIDDRAAVESTKQSLQSAQAQAQLQQQQAAQTVQAEASKQLTLDAQAKTAEKQALVDTAKCRILAPMGLDCDGHRPTVIVSGGGTGTTP